MLPRMASLLALLLLGFLLAPVPASAVVQVLRTDTTTGVLYAGCHDHAFNYDVDTPETPYSWEADLDLVAPDGSEVSSDYVYGFDDDDSGQGSFLLCGSDPVGSYTISGTGTWEDVDGEEHTLQVLTTTFTVRRAKATIGLKASTKNPDLGDKVKLSILVTDERLTGFFPTEGARAVLQTRAQGGAWRTQPSSRWSTGATGKDSLRVTWKSRRPLDVRAKLLPDNYSGKKSNSITLR